MISPENPHGLCILVPVYHPYSWIAPFMAEALETFWPNHPPIFFCGLTSAEAPHLPTLPLSETALPRDWAAFTLDAISALQSQGFSQCYLLLEEHLPLAPCQTTHLNSTLPVLLEKLQASYIGLMGWDNRRYSTRAPILSQNEHCLMHLSTPQAPRFHLHPSLWRIDALADALRLTLHGKNHTPWRFEKVNERHDAELPAQWKNGCYQISGAMLSLRKPSITQNISLWIERVIFHKLMAIHQFVPTGSISKKLWQWIGFDNFYYDGPYPMFFSGVMAKGEINPFFIRYMQRNFQTRRILEALLVAKNQHSHPTSAPTTFI